MGKCINHPEKETSYLCMKHNIYLCDDCLECRDPDIYCKFRSSCPIHFISTKNFDSEAGEAAVKEFSILFQPGDVKIKVTKGTNLLEASQKADLYVNASCNGKGSCGKCKLIVESGVVENEILKISKSLQHIDNKFFEDYKFYRFLHLRQLSYYKNNCYSKKTRF